MIDIEITPTQIATVPSSWDELTAQQLQAYCAYLLPFRKEIFITDAEKNIYVKDEKKPIFDSICFSMLSSFLNIPLEDFFELKIAQLQELIYEHKILNFLWETYDLTNNLFPSFECDNQVFHGPMDFSLVTFDEFYTADKHFTQFIITNDDTHLDKLVGTLYRSPIENYNIEDHNDIRKPFRPLVVDYYAYRICAVEQDIKLAIFVWYESCRGLMVEKFRPLFEGSESSEDSSHDQLALAIAGGVVNYETVRNQPIMLVLTDMLRQKNEHKKMKEAMK